VSARGTGAGPVEEAPLAIQGLSGASGRGLEEGRMTAPDVLGLSARQALAVFARLGLTARLSGTGFVVSQDPPPGSAIRPGDSQILRLSETVPPISRPGRGREESAPFTGP